MAGKWRTIRVFISSTFRDMHAERDILVKEVFPELRRRLTPHRVHFVDVDLRWGLSQPQADNVGAVRFCLDQIDACRPFNDEQERPFFIGLIGQRYGWQPRQFTPECLAAHRWLVEHPEYGGEEALRHSITAMEIIYGVALQPPFRGNSFFYFRSPEYLERARSILKQRHAADPAALADALAALQERYLGSAEEREATPRLDALKQRIRSCRQSDGSPVPCREYSPEWDPDRVNREDPGKPRGRLTRESLRPFADMVLADLWQALIRQFPEFEENRTAAGEDPDAQDSDSHQLFAESRLRVFIGREQELRELFRFAADNDDCPCVVTGAPGSGKSTLLSQFAQEYARIRPDDLLVSHFVGANARSTSAREMARRIGAAIRTGLQLPDEIGSSSPDPFSQLHAIISAVPRNRRVVVVIDAVDQLDDEPGARQLTWLPVNLPENVKFIISCIEGTELGGPVFAALQERMHLPLPVSQLTREQRREFIRQVPSLSAKTLEPKQVELLLDNPASGNPLFLSVALEELRGFGGYETLEESIANLPRATSDPAKAIFLHVLKRLKSEYDERVVHRALTSLAASRSGLREAELEDLVSDFDHDQSLYPILLQLRAYLLNRGELIHPYHGSLQRAIVREWMNDDDSRRAAHRVLANYFFDQPDWYGGVPNVRRADELPWQLLRAGEWDRLEQVLCSLQFIDAKCEAGRVNDLQRDYRESLAAWPGSEQTPGYGGEERGGRTYSGDSAVEDFWLEQDPRAQPEIQPPAYGPEDVIPASCLPPDRGGEAALLEMRRTASDSLDPASVDDSPPTRIAAFARFVEEHAYVLEGKDREVIPLARNHADRGPVVDAAEALLALRTTPWIARRDRPQGVRSGQQPLFVRILDHGEEIDSLALTPDGKTAVTICRRDRKLRRWDLSTGTCEYVVRDLAANLSISADGRTLAGIPGPVLPDWDDHAASQEELRFNTDCTNRAACVWDAQTGIRRHLLVGHTDSVRAVALARDADVIVTGGDDRTLRILRASTGECLSTIDAFDSRVKDVALSDDGRIAAALTVDNCVRVWDTASGRCLSIFLVEALPERRASAGERSFGFGGFGQVDAADLTAALARMQGTVSRVVMSCDGRLVVTLTNHGEVDVWDARTGRRLRHLVCDDARNSAVKDVALSDDGRLLAVARDGLQLWDVVRGERVREFQAFEMWIKGVKLTADARFAATWSGDVFAMTENKLRLWDIVHGCFDVKADSLEDYVIQLQTSSLAVTPDGRTGLSGSGMSHMLREWDLVAKTPRQTFETPGDIITSVDLSADGQLAVWGTYQAEVLDPNPHRGGHVRVSFLPNQAYLRCFRVGDTPALCARLSPDGTVLYAVSESTGIQRWDLLTGRRELAIDDVSGTSLAAGPDGRLLVMGTKSGGVSLWDGHSGRSCEAWQSHDSEVTALAVSPDGRVVAAGFDDGTLSLWDHTTGRIAILGRHHDSIRCVRFSGDARWVVSSGLDQAVRVWDRESATCVAIHNCGSPAAVISELLLDVRFVTGCLNGQVPFLELRGVEIERPWVTAVRCWHCDFHRVMDQWLSDRTGQVAFAHAGGYGAAIDAARDELSRRASDWKPLLEEGEPLAGEFDPEFVAFCPHCGALQAVPDDVLQAIRNTAQMAAEDGPPCAVLDPAAWDEPRLSSECSACRRPLRFNPFVVENPAAPPLEPRADFPQPRRTYDRFTFENRLKEHEEFVADESNITAMVSLALMVAPMQLSMNDEQGFNASMGLVIQYGGISAPLLAQQLLEGDVTSRRFAARTLGLLDPEHASCAIDALQRALEDDDPSTRSLAAQALAALAPGNSQVVDALIAEWRAADGDVWQTAMRLAEAATSESINALAEVFPHGSRELQMAAAIALATLGNRAQNVLPVLTAARDSADPVLLSTLDAAIQQITASR